MKRAGKVRWGELKVGVVILFALAFLIYASFKGGGTSIFETVISYRAFFTDLDGLVQGSPVWLSGVEVGSVKKVRFLEQPLEDGTNIEVVFGVKSSVKYMITRGSKIQLGTIGLLGDKYVRLLPGPPSEIELPEESILPVLGTAGLAGALEKLPETMDRFNSILQHWDNLIAQVDTGSGTLSRLIKDDQLATDIALLVERSGNLMNTLVTSTSSITRDFHLLQQDFHALADQLTNGEGTITKLLKDPAPFHNLVSATATLDTVLSRINEGDGTAGQLVNDQELYTNIKDLMARLNTLVADMMDNPKKYFKFSVF